MKSETAIPAGLYDLAIQTTETSLTKRWLSKDWIKQGGWFTRFIWIKNVPNFEGIYIHAGGDKGDTAGCPLIGYKIGSDYLSLSGSRDAMRDFYKFLFPRLEKGERWQIEIIDV